MEHRRHIANHRRHVAGIVPYPGVLYLYDIGTHRAQQPGGIGPWKKATQIKDTYSAER